MIEYKNGNILNATTHIIAHQVNSLGIMGAGVALQIKNKWPIVFESYYKLCNDTVSLRLLGRCQIIQVDPNLGIANLFGQYDYGIDRRQTDYFALQAAMTSCEMQMRKLNLTSIAFPDMIGCGLAGGDRGIVLKIIEDTFKDFDVEIWKFVNG
jgi:O-acetyl-ADP-ribose deacetylase (regulator of RNase III)